MEIEAKIEENKKLKERVKCLMDFQLACKRKAGHKLCLSKDPRVRLISMQKSMVETTMKPHRKVPALYFGPAENRHVSKYRMVMKRFPVSFSKPQWSETEKENLAKGLKQQYQEMLLVNSMNLESDLEGSMNPDLMSALLSNDVEVTPEKIRSFLPMVNWDRLASMYLTGRSGSECESRWLNCEDPLINKNPWTVLEDKKLLFIVQERGIYNWVDIAITLGTQRTPFQCLARYQRSLNPHILNKDWTEEEDAALRAAVECFGENWQLVASNLEGRTGTQCSNRWRKSLHPGRKKVGRWSVDEDKRLKVAVMLFGSKNWNKIAQFAPGRTQVQCRERWHNCLDPSLKLEPWTKEEDANLLEAIAKHGYSWSRIATCLPPRTDNQCMRRWKVLCPDEVLLRRASQKIKKTVLISNFVDRETERPAIGPSDFSSLAVLPSTECGESTERSKKSEKKIKKSRSKPRKSPKEILTEGGPEHCAEQTSSDLCLVPTVPSVSTNTSVGGTKKRRQISMSEREQLKTQRTTSCDKKFKKSTSKPRKSPEDSLRKSSLRESDSEHFGEHTDLCLVPVVPSMNADTSVKGTKRRRQKSSRYNDDFILGDQPWPLMHREGRQPKIQRTTLSHNEQEKSESEVGQSGQIIPADSMLTSSEVDSAWLSSVPNGNTVEIGNTRGITEATSSHNEQEKAESEVGQSRQIIPADSMLTSSEVDPFWLSSVPNVNIVEIGNTKGITEATSSAIGLQARRSTSSNAEGITLTGQTEVANDEVDPFADDDAPLISWLDSFASKSRRKLSRDKLSRYSRDDIEPIRTQKPRGKKKRFLKCTDMLLEEKNNKSCNSDPHQKDFYNQLKEGDNSIIVKHTADDITFGGASVSDGSPNNGDLLACPWSDANGIQHPVPLGNESLFGFI